MKYITQETKQLLEERGIFIFSHSNSIRQDDVIHYLREEFGYIIDVRFTNFGYKYSFSSPHYYALIFKKNSTTFMKEVPEWSNDYYDMAEFAIRAALELIHNKRK